jgi:hypothetical protein
MPSNATVETRWTMDAPQPHKRSRTEFPPAIMELTNPESVVK